MVPLVAHVTADDILVVIYCSVADAVDLGGAINLRIGVLIVCIIDWLGRIRVLKLYF